MSLSSAHIVNGDFERPDPNFTEYLFAPPIMWERVPVLSPDAEDCFAAIYPDPYDPNRLILPNPEHGQSIQWELPKPKEGDHFVVLSTGDIYPDTPRDELIRGSSIVSEPIQTSAGDLIIGSYFFGTCDYLNYYDYGHIYAKLDPNYVCENPDPNFCPAEQFTIAYKELGNDDDDIGSYGSTEGWIDFAYVVEPNQAGPYQIHIEVCDGIDKLYKSYLAVDNLRICYDGQSPRDLNDDCDVNLTDFALLSEVWLSFCPDPPIDDPNFPGDPNDYPPPVDPNYLELCELADFDHSWYVDPNDLIIMTDDWLIENDP